MNTINSALKQISIFKLAAVLLLIFLIAVIFDFDGIFDFLEIILLLFFIYKFKDCKADFKKKFKGIFSQRYLKNIFIIVILNILFSYGMIYLSYLILYFIPDLYSLFTFSIGDQSIAFAGSLLSVILLAPIVEELLFRGIIFNKINDYFSLTVAILVSSFLFGISHEFGGMFSAFVFGICMVMLYLKTSNILVPIFAHFLNNLFSEIIYYLDYNSILFSNTLVIIVVSILAIVSAYLLFASIFKEWRKLS